jgi:hypothetical protein
MPSWLVRALPLLMWFVVYASAQSICSPYSGDEPTCLSHTNCKFHPYVPLCYFSPAEIQSAGYNCSFWGTDARRCIYDDNGCSFANGVFCANLQNTVGVPTGGTAATAASIDAIFTVPSVRDNSAFLELDVTAPVPIWINAPVCPLLLAQWPQQLNQVFTADPGCTNQNSFVPLSPVVLNYTAGTESTLQAAFRAHIDAYHLLNFSLATPEGVALASWRDQCGLAALATPFFRSISTLSTTHVVYHIAINMDNPNCTSVAYFDAPPTSRIYSSNTSYCERQFKDGRQLTTCAVTTGLTVTRNDVTGFNRNVFNTFYPRKLTVMDNQYSYCNNGAGLTFSVTLRLDYDNNYQPDKFVGPRNTSDLYVNRNPIDGDVMSCYAPVVTNFTRLPYDPVNLRSSSLVTIQSSNCRTDCPDNGQCFCSCQYAPALQRFIDLGSVSASYDTSLDGVFDVFVDAYVYDVATPELGKNVNSALTGVPDLFDAKICFPFAFNNNTNLTHAMSVQGGTLVDPLTSNIDDFMVTGLGNVSLLLTPNGSLPLCLRMSDPVLLATTELSIRNVTITPLNGVGDVLPTSDILYLADLLGMSAFVTKAFRDAYCTGCPVPTLVRNYPGMDCIVPLNNRLFHRSPAQAYEFIVLYTQTRVASASRRLLSSEADLQSFRFIVQPVNFTSDGSISAFNVVESFRITDLGDGMVGGTVAVYTVFASVVCVLIAGAYQITGWVLYMQQPKL